MRICDGSLIDLINHLDIIRKLIPEKSDLTETEVIERLSNKEYGVKLAVNNSINGIIVWYDDNNSLYIWLGVVLNQSKGITGKILQEIFREKEYKRSYAKINPDNIVAIKSLEKFGFQKYKTENNIAYLEKFF
jgi:hypothetical protein